MQRAIFLLLASAAFAAGAGFHPLFNGNDLTGWHIRDVKNGVRMGTQEPHGSGGILLTGTRIPRNWQHDWSGYHRFRNIRIKELDS